jgi:hypothetical protein
MDFAPLNEHSAMGWNVRLDEVGMGKNANN